MGFRDRTSSAAVLQPAGPLLVMCLSIMMVAAGLSAPPVSDFEDAGAIRAESRISNAAVPATQRAEASFAKLPPRFEVNRGQFPARVRFMVRQSGLALFLTPGGPVVSFPEAPRRGGGARDPVVRMRFAGANPEPVMQGIRRLSGTSNYMIGPDPSKWHTGVPSFAGVRYKDVYPGIDVVFHGRRDVLEYDFEVDPGADPSQIRLAFSGGRPEIDGSGDLLVRTPAGSLRQHAPVSYQEVAGDRRRVRSRFALERDEVRFGLGMFDSSRQLVIDPALEYATYLGGPSPDALSLNATGIAVDPQGSAYITGDGGNGFPKTGGAYDGSCCMFVTKLSPDGSSIVYSAYIGEGTGQGIDVDAAGNAYVVGRASSGFPVTANGLQPCSGSNAVLAKLNAAGSDVLYATCLGSVTTWAYDVAVDRSGAAYVTGETRAGLTPTPGAFDATCGTDGFCDRTSPISVGASDAFVVKLDPGKVGPQSLVYSTFLGGRGDDVGIDIAVESSCASACSVYVGGSTESTCSTANAPGCFPTEKALQAISGGGADAFLSRLNASGSELEYSTYFGGESAETALLSFGVAVTPGGMAYISGATSSADLATAGAAFPKCTLTAEPDTSVCRDSFVVKLDTGAVGGASRVFATYLGGSGRDFAVGVATDGAGNATVAGWTLSEDFPVTLPVAKRGLGPDAFVTQFSPGGAVRFSSYLGGNELDQARGVAAGEAGGIFVAGGTKSTDFPGANDSPIQSQHANGGDEEDGLTDLFVAKLGAPTAGVPVVTALAPQTGPVSGGTVVEITGVGFTGTSSVTFGGVGATFEVHSDNRITATAPPQPEGTAAMPVNVSAGGGVSPSNPISSFVYGDGSWRSTGQLLTPRRDFSATLLATGDVLVLGGTDGNDDPVSTAELYDPATETWKTTNAPSISGVPVLLVPPACAGPLRNNCGKVLLVGDRAAQLYNPANELWVSTTPPLSSMSKPVMLKDGRVLSIGTPSQIYDPATEIWTTTTSPAVSRFYLGPSSTTATLLESGDVLLAGGCCEIDQETFNYDSHFSAEISDPGTGLGRRAADMSAGRAFHAASRLGNGHVLVSGGLTGAAYPATYNSAEVYDPQNDQWRAAATLRYPRRRQFSLGLPNGDVLSGGGRQPVALAESYSTRHRSWRSAGLMPTVNTSGAPTPVVLSSDPSEVRADPAVCGNNCGKVLVMGESAASRAAYLYTPAPSISELTPAGGAAEGGTVVTITGTGFTHGDTKVYFGRVASDNVTVESYSKLTAVAPPAREGREVAVTVVTEGGRSSAGPQSKFDYSGLPGAVADLTAKALSGSEVELTFSAPGSLGGAPPPAGKYVVKQSRTPLTDNASFEAATTLCGGVCSFIPAHVGDKLTLSVTELTPKTTYYYALKPQEDAGGLGPMSNVANATTLGSTPGRVTDLDATPLSGREVKLTFSAPGSNGDDPPPAKKYLVKLSKTPILDADNFADAKTLCGGSCNFRLKNVGTKLTISVKDSSPNTTYYYALRAGDAAGAWGPISNVASATTLDITPGRVDDLKVRRISRKAARLRFSAPSSDGEQSSPARKYIIKLSRRPIKDVQSFDNAKSLCGGVCNLKAESVGDKVSLDVTDLRPKTRYYFAVRARHASGAVGLISNTAKLAGKLRKDNRAPARVKGVRAKVLSSTVAALKFNAPGSNGAKRPPARAFIVKLARSPIVNRKTFRAGKSLCGGVCKLRPAHVGDRLRVVVKGLRPRTTYYLAVRARDRAGNVSRRSKTVRITTR